MKPASPIIGALLACACLVVASTSTTAQESSRTNAAPALGAEGAYPVSATQPSNFVDSDEAAEVWLKLAIQERKTNPPPTYRRPPATDSQRSNLMQLVFADWRPFRPQPFDDSPTNLSEAVVEKALPEDYAQFERALSGKYDTNEVAAAFRLVDQSREALRHEAEGSPEQKNAMDVCRGAWRLALRINLGATEAAATNLFLAEWNKRLRDPDVLAASQLFALARVGDSRLMTPVLWEVLEQTDSRRMAMALGWLIAMQADSAECEKAEEALPKNRRIKRRDEDIIALSISGRRYTLNPVIGNLPSTSFAGWDFY